jgi:galactitol-specific phosphotransferase system IIB component
VRARPERTRRVFVVCPSGMATTQLLVARLRSRFPRLGSFEVLSMRELSAERLAEADLIVTTVPLALPAFPPIDVIHVHPMLRPEDIAALTQWMA